MDGTLIGADGLVSRRNLAAMQAARDAGIEVVIATGRRHSYAMRVLRGLGFPESSLLISSNGTVTRTIGAELIDRTHLSSETTLWLCEHLREFRNAMVITYDLVRPDGDDAYGALLVEHLEDLHSSIGKWMEANAPYIEHAVPLKDVILRRAVQHQSPIQVMLCGTIDRMRRVEARLLEHPRAFAAGITPPARLADAEVVLNRTEYPARDLSLVDLLPAGCSKGAAVMRLAASRGIEIAATMAIGDNWNDVSMLEVAGRPVLMENAPQDLKAVAALRGWNLGGHHAEDGVADAIWSVLGVQLADHPTSSAERCSVLA